jgi:predicted metal-binding membrane protein
MTHTESGLGPLMRATPFARLVILAVIGCCWIFLLSGMGMGDIKIHMPTPIGMVMMWWVMMLAMMLPGTLRHLLVQGDTQAGIGPFLGLFLSGYALVWFGYALAATALQYGLVSAAILHPIKMSSTNAFFSIAILSVAGAFQFTNIKTNSLIGCQERRSTRNPLVAGLAYGVHCMTASIALMSLLFVGGVMNIYWIVSLTLIVAIEKLLSDPRAFSVAIGLGCFLTAAAIAFSTF